MEVLGYHKNTDQDIKAILNLLETFKTYPLYDAIKKRGIFFMQEYKLKLADSIIAATAWHFDLPLITGDSDFSKVDEIKVVQFF